MLCCMATALQGSNHYSVGWCESKCHINHYFWDQLNNLDGHLTNLRSFFCGISNENVPQYIFQPFATVHIDVKMILPICICIYCIWGKAQPLNVILDRTKAAICKQYGRKEGSLQASEANGFINTWICGLLRVNLHPPAWRYVTMCI